MSESRKYIENIASNRDKYPVFETLTILLQIIYRDFSSYCVTQSSKLIRVIFPSERSRAEATSFSIRKRYTRHTIEFSVWFGEYNKADAYKIAEVVISNSSSIGDNYFVDEHEFHRFLCELLCFDPDMTLPNELIEIIR